MAAAALPENIKEALEWAEYIANTNGIYKSALKRIAAYCVTDIEVVPAKAATSTLDTEKRERYVKLFSSNKLDAKKLGVDFAMALLIYGNVFVSMHSKFIRRLECPDCHAILRYEAARDNPNIKLRFEDFQYKGTCPRCKTQKNFMAYEDYSTKPEDLYVKFWNPHDIDLQYDAFTGEAKVVWRIPAEYRTLIRSGRLDTVENCPQNIIDVIREDGNLVFDKDVLLHSKETALPGIKADGWGIPAVIANFRAAWYWQLINKYNEVFATDFIMPKRCISPASQGDSPSDPVLGSGLTTFMNAMRHMIKGNNLDPASWLISPYPIQYQTLGGDAAKFMPKDQLDYAKSVLLTSIGIPVELFDGTLQLQSAPCALRLFENNWAWLVDALKVFLNFMATRAAFHLQEDPVELRYKRITHVDDLSRQQSVLQLGSAGEISRTSMLASLGLDKREETRLMLEEDRDTAKLQEQQQEDLETMQMFKSMVPDGVQVGLQNIQAQQQQADAQQAGGGGMPASGGMPAGAAPAQQGMIMPGMSPIDQMLANAGALPTDSPEDLAAKAQTLAQQAMQCGPQRASFLRKLKSKDPQIHALVKGMVEDMDQQAATQGKQQVLAQQYGGGQ